MSRFPCRTAIVGITFWLSLAHAAAADGPSVVASIKPLHSLVAGVMAELGNPVLLIEGGASPHTTALRPSDAASLQSADVVFWVGPELETFLEKPLHALPKQDNVVALHEADGVRLLPYRRGGLWEAHRHHGHDEAHEEGQAEGDKHEEHADAPAEHHEDRHDEHGDAHARGEFDMHIWLDPSNASAMVKQIATTLSAADPANAAHYQANASAVRQRLVELDATLKHVLAPIANHPYIVFHDAYQYFETRYGLAPAGSITVNPEIPASARRLSEIREKIVDAGATCVFSEPQFEPAVVQTLVEGTEARTGTLDPLGADLETGPNAYFTLMRNLAKSLTRCFDPTG